MVNVDVSSVGDRGFDPADPVKPKTITFAFARLVIGTSRTVGSAKKFVRITSVLVEESSRRRFARYVHVKN
jgi:hypothetical protein